MPCLGKLSLAQMGYPSPFGTVAAHGLALVAGTAIQTGTATLLQADNGTIAWHEQREGQVGVSLGIGIGGLLGGQDEMSTESPLGIKTDASCHKVRIELLDAFKVQLAESMDAIGIETERLVLLM